MSDAPHVSSDALTSKPLALRVMPMPADLNPAGDVFGGWIMAMVDVAGAMPAIRRAGSRVVTVAVNSFVFKQPVGVGDIVSFHAEVAAVGKSSVTVDVEVFAERNPKAPEVVKVTEARLTYVAVGEDGSKRAIPAEAPAGHGQTLLFLQQPAELNVINRHLGEEIKGALGSDIADPGTVQNGTEGIEPTSVDRTIHSHILQLGHGPLHQCRGVDKTQDAVGQGQCS